MQLIETWLERSVALLAQFIVVQLVFSRFQLEAEQSLAKYNGLQWGHFGNGLNFDSLLAHGEERVVLGPVSRARDQAYLLGAISSIRKASEDEEKCAMY